MILRLALQLQQNEMIEPFSWAVKEQGIYLNSIQPLQRKSRAIAT
jgi:hypothetical protein